MEPLYGDQVDLYEISEYRDDRHALMQRLNWLQQNHVVMVGYNSESYDYPLLHLFFMNPNVTYEQLHAKSQQIINSGYGDNRWAHTIWPRDRFAPQIDLYKLHHFDNKAKVTSLKALQFAMRSKTVRESRLPFDKPVAQPDVDGDLIPYNKHDVSETKQFALFSLDAINFRIGLVPQFGIECLSWNDTKIGEKMLEQRLGDDICYERDERGKRHRRQTVRSVVRLADIIFPYVQFQNAEFQRVHQFMLQQVLRPDELDDEGSTAIRTKGVFTDLTAHVGGLTFHFGTGGVHASVEAQRFHATDEWLIRDIDVASLYPSLAIVNRLAPEHLGQAFVAEYAKIPAERKEHAKGTYMNAALKLAANGAWGKSNSPYSVFYDSKYAMQIPINGQLLICMLVEWLMVVPTINLIQANTDGVTYRIHRDHLAQAQAIEQQWQDYTHLVLEDASYRSMWIRDVNNYVALDTKGNLKQKGAYWHPDPLDYAGSISNASPPSWHKDHSNIISTRAAVLAMVHGVDPADIIRSHTDPFDFMLRCKVGRSDQLLLGDAEVQRMFRYYVARNGAPLVKVSPPVAGGVVGQWKRAQGVTKAAYDAEMLRTGGEWSEAVCTKNRSKYDERRTSIESSWLVADCCDADWFDWSNVNYDYYIAEARKLIIA
jgi:hypothetical protein